LLNPEWCSQSHVASEHFPEMQGLDWAGPLASGIAPPVNTDAQSQSAPFTGNFVWQRILISFPTSREK